MEKSCEHEKRQDVAVILLLIYFCPFFFFSANILKLSPVLAQNSLITVNANMDILMVLLVNLWRYLLTAPAF